MTPHPPLPEGQDKVRAVRTMFDTIAPRYELVNRLITFGLDARWRRHAVGRLRLAPGATVLDLACGTGDLCRVLQRAGHNPIGVDLSLGMLKAARTTAPLVQADVLHLPFADGSVDGVTCGFALRNFVELPGFFQEVRRVLRPGGQMSLVDAYQPTHPAMRAMHSLYFGKIVPVIGGLFSDVDAYRYLPRSLGYLPPIPQILSSIRDAGFSEIHRDVLAYGAAHCFSGTAS